MTDDEWTECIRIRADWADEVLRDAGYVEWGCSDAHGLSRYYIRDGDELTDAERIQIRVSDHYAHPIRYYCCDERPTWNYIVEIKPALTREQVEEATRKAIAARDKDVRETVVRAE